MSRFYAAGSDSETGSSSDEEVEITRPVITKTMAFIDDDDDVRRVLRSTKDKRFTELKDIIKKVKNHKKIRDMANILSDFDEMVRAFDKSKKVIEKEGNPRFYVRYLVELEGYVTEAWEDKVARKALSKNNAKGLTSLRQKLKKHAKDFENDMNEYRLKPDVEGEVSEEEEEVEEEDESSEDEIIIKKEPVKEISVKKTEKKIYDEEDSDYWVMTTSSDSSSESDDNRATGQLTADYFIKKSVRDPEEKREKKVRKAKVVEAKDEQEEDDEKDGEWQEVKGGAAISLARPKMFTKENEITVPNVLRKLYEIVSVRGKKNTEYSEQFLLLEELRKIALDKNLGVMLDVKIMFNLVSCIFDYNINVTNCMKTETWEKALEYVTELLKLLVDNQATILCSINIPEELQNIDALDNPSRYFINGCILTYVEKLDDEYTKMLQACDAHSTEFVIRLRDESRICQIIEDLQAYLELQRLAEPLPGAHEDFNLITEDNICRSYLKRIEHIYYKSEFALNKNKSDEEKYENCKIKVQLIDDLCKYIYKHDSTDRLRTRAVLAQVYHHAIHDKWKDGRDLMLMSHLQETIHYSDIPTQILYNRATVQLGLCAFRSGYIKDAHNCIVDIQSSGRAKELLAQGLLLQRQSDRTPEQEKIEKRRLMPYHMHINLELLECVYLISAMLIEIPYMAAHEFDARRRMISKNFHYVMRTADNMSLVGPPESMREHVVAASRSMKKGDWNKCFSYIVNEKMDNKVWHLFFNSETVKTMLKEKIKNESLRTYLFSFSSIYDSISLDTLTEMFSLDIAEVQTIVNKLIINDEIMASMHEPTNNLVMHRTEPSHLQALALQLSEKLSSLVDYNERAFDFKTGSFFVAKQGNNREGQTRTNDRNYEKSSNQNKTGGYQNKNSQQYGRNRHQVRQGGNY